MEDLRDFQPISLVASLQTYCKDIGNRLKKVMGRKISETWNAFGRQILDQL